MRRSICRVRYPGGGEGNQERSRRPLLMGRSCGTNLTEYQLCYHPTVPNQRWCVSYFSPLQWAGTAFYGDPFAPIIDIISDFGWSILPQFPGSARPEQGPTVRPGIPIPLPGGPVISIPIPVGRETGSTGQEARVYSVLPGSTGGGPTPAPRKTVVVEGTTSVIEEHPEGDFPAGSIFAPGQVWGGVSSDLDVDEQPVMEEPVGLWTELFSAGVDVLQGQYNVGNYGIQPMGINPAITRPAGQVALPPSAAPQLVTASPVGGDCGNRRYVTLDRQTGRISCKRRRRRRLLTNRDLADLASLKTITGGGAALNSAVIRAVR